MGNVLDPIFNFSDSGIDSMAWTFIAIADNTNLCDPKEYFKCFPFLYMYCFVHLPFSDIISGPPESPWQESLPLSPAQMWKLSMCLFDLGNQRCANLTFQFFLGNNLCTFHWRPLLHPPPGVLGMVCHQRRLHPIQSL